MSPESDAYKTPEAPLTAAHLGARIYSPQQVMFAAFLGSPLAGCWLLARNYESLRRLAARRTAMISGVVATIAVFFIAYSLPDRFPNMLLPVTYCLVIREIAKSQVGRDFDALIAAGAQRASWWSATGVGMAGLAGIIAVLAAAFAVDWALMT